MDIREILRRLRKGQSNRAVAKALGVDRKTVGRYRHWATEQGLLHGPLPPLSELHQLVKETLNTALPPQNVSSVERYREQVEKLRRDGVEMAAIHERLKERGYTGSYSAVYRFVRNLEPLEPDVTVRVETRPGEEAQVDFGYAGRMIDPDTGTVGRDDGDTQVVKLLELRRRSPGRGRRGGFRRSGRRRAGSGWSSRGRRPRPRDTP